MHSENDKATQEWKEGDYAVTFYQLTSDPSPNREWLILDGTVDAIWIENKTTVLDGSKQLCFPNNEIVHMLGTMSMVFKIGDLVVASPASIS